MNTFILSYNPFDGKASGSQIHAYVTDCRKITQYYQPWLGTYVLRSFEEMPSLLTGFNGLFHGTSYILAQVQPLQMNGLLDPSIWNWINTGNLPALPPTLDNTKTGSLF